MTPKEKAKELVDRLIKTDRICDCYCDPNLDESEYLQSKIALESAKQCALICVDEITEILMNLRGEFMDLKNISYSKTESLEYWQEVKQQIEKL